MSIWDLRCEAACPNRYESNVSIFETLQHMRWDGWAGTASYSGQFLGVFCPEHSGLEPEVSTELLPKWVVECGECFDLEDEAEFDSEEEARRFAREHELDHNCDCHDHWCVVLNPEKQKERAERRAKASAGLKDRDLERKAQEHYVAYLMEEDQKRRDMQGQEKTREASQINTVGLVFIGLLLVAAVLLVWGAN